AMAQVELGLEDAQAALAPYADRLAVAVSNSSRATVLSGGPAALEELLAALAQRGVFGQHIKGDVAAASPQGEPLGAVLHEQLAAAAPQPGTIPIYSTVDGAPREGRGFDPASGAHNLREPVRFAATVQRLLADRHTLFVEISPHPVLLPAIDDILRE